MRIKKKELLEALNVDKTKTDLDNAKEVLNYANDFKKEVKNTLGNDEEAEEIADDITGAILDPEERSISEEGEDKVHTKKKKVKEVIKIKDLKK